MAGVNVEARAPLHFSTLKSISRSAAHYRTRADREDEWSSAQERQMRVGTLAHGLILEPGRNDFVVWDGKVRNGKAWDAFKAEHAGRLIVTAPELVRGQRIADAVRGCPVAAPHLDGVCEQELPPWQWLSGRWCGGRPDVVRPDAREVVEVKTTPDASPAWMARHALRMAYHAQLAWYNLGAAAAHGVRFDKATIIAVETKPPYAVTTFALTEHALVVGEKICHAWLSKLLAHEAVDEWPAYSQAEVPLDVIDADDLIYDAEEEEDGE